MKNINLKSILLCAVISFIVGFFLGKTFIKDKVSVKQITKYIKSPYKVTDSISYPVPYKVFIDKNNSKKIIPSKIISVNKEKKEVEDSSAILKDYFLSKRYNLDFSNDTLGVFKIDAVVNQNRLVNAVSTIQPIIRTIETKETIYKVPIMQFYGIVGSSLDMKTTQIQLGIDLRQKIIIGISGIQHNNSYGYTINAGIKF